VDRGVNELFEISATAAADAATAARALAGTVITLLSLPLALTIAAFAAYQIAMPWRSSALGTLLWLGGGLSILSSVCCAIYGALRWRFLSIGQRLVVVFYGLWVPALAAWVTGLLIQLKASGYPSKM
jgi:hypothetical protein